MLSISPDQYQVDEVYKDDMAVCGSNQEEEKYVEWFGGET